MGLKQFFRDLFSEKTDVNQDNEKRFQQFLTQLNYGTITNQYPYINNLGTYTPGIDYDIGTNNAMRIATVFTCVLVRAESLSSLPVNVMQSTPTGSKVAYNHPVYRLIHNKPNPFQTASSFWKSVSAHIDLFGECFCHVRYSGRIQPVRIDLIQDPNSVQILETEGGNAQYEYNGKKYADYEMLHFKDLSLDGYRGCSKISYNAQTMGYAHKLKTYGSNAIGTKPPGYFTTAQNYDVVKRQEGNLQKGWSDNIAEGKTPLLPFGLEYKNLQISPGDAQYLEAVGATKEDIYGIFRIPPTLAQNYERATFANAEQQDLVFVKHTMLPIITNIEQECNAKLFAESNTTSQTPYYVKFNINAFLRGDFATQTQGFRTLWERGLISGNMVADLMDWDRFEGGDERWVPMNMIPLSKVEEFINKLTKPIDSNAGNEGGDPDNSQRNGVDILLKKNGHKVNGHAN
ncbi:MAG TPA: phage portal protein [Ohtaekwangia sp.]|nr:phage portal protein [Ohtaekwangia sp.]